MRIIAQLMLAKFYPDGFVRNLSRGQSISKPLIAFMVMNHPGYREDVLKYISPELLEHEKRDIQKSGLGVIDPISEAYSLF